LAQTVEEQNVRLIRRWFQEVWNERREEIIDELFHPDVYAHGLGEQPLGFEEFKGMWRSFHETFANLRCEVHDAFGCGDKTACRFTVTGTHRETGKPISFEGQTITRWQDGKIVEGWNVIDMAAVYRQIGVLAV
jgi:predicted ester cyclase